MKTKTGLLGIDGKVIHHKIFGDHADLFDSFRVVADSGANLVGIGITLKAPKAAIFATHRCHKDKATKNKTTTKTAIITPFSAAHKIQISAHNTNLNNKARKTTDPITHVQR